MSRIIAKYYQNCDVCHKKVDIQSEDTLLDNVLLPMDCIATDGSRKLTVNRLSVCEDCLLKLKEVLQSTYDLYEFEYGGVTMRLKEEHHAE
jgi:hypothetical protein